jgi:hypothetical protein
LKATDTTGLLLALTHLRIQTKKNKKNKKSKKTKKVKKLKTSKKIGTQR